MNPIELHREADDIWVSEPIRDFDAYIGALYMFRIEPAQGQTVYRTDIQSRWQAGRGATRPSGLWSGDLADLDGGVSCSVVIDQDAVRADFEPTTSPPVLVSDDEFWQRIHPGAPDSHSHRGSGHLRAPRRALGFRQTRPGHLDDAMRLLDQLTELGVNAVELLPMSEFSGNVGWGYGDTHHFGIESSAGGRDEYKHFVRECHRRGIAVIQDVVYNHFDGNAERAEWQYDSDRRRARTSTTGTRAGPPTTHAAKAAIWTTGRPDPPRGTGRSRCANMFISSAAVLVDEFHVDGLRVDLTQAIHARQPPPRRRPARRQREHVRAEDAARVEPDPEDDPPDGHARSPRTTPAGMRSREPPDAGGLGFDATWFATFYHNLIGDSDMAGGYARLLRRGRLRRRRPLAMGDFAGRLWRASSTRSSTRNRTTRPATPAARARTSLVAVNRAPLCRRTRDTAEARCRIGRRTIAAVGRHADVSHGRGDRRSA